MKIRIKYSKLGNLRFIGHLDVMRYFQKEIRRAGLDVSYSKGYSPHQIISFAAPLAMGITSDGEYFDGEFESVTTSREMIDALNAVSVDEMKVTECVLLPDDAKNSMSVVSASDYVISFLDKAGTEERHNILDSVESFMSQDQIVILKKTKMFAGDPAPFVMELPAYHMPTVGNVLRSMWERGWSFIKKAGTIITLSTIFVWFTSYFGWVDGAFQMLSEDQMSHSILAYIGKGICWIFAPLGWGDWQATVAAVTGLVAKENIVATMGILYGGGDGVYSNLAAAFTGVAGMSFLIFNLLCAPCFAAMGAIKREMNNTKWFWFAIGYECGFAYVIALIVNQLGNLFTGQLMTAGNGVVNIISLIAAFALIVAMIYLLVRPYKESNKLGVKVKA